MHNIILLCIYSSKTGRSSQPQPNTNIMNPLERFAPQCCLFYRIQPAFILLTQNKDEQQESQTACYLKINFKRQTKNFLCFLCVCVCVCVWVCVRITTFFFCGFARFASKSTPYSLWQVYIHAKGQSYVVLWINKRVIAGGPWKSFMNDAWVSTLGLHTVWLNGSTFSLFALVFKDEFAS